MNRTVGIAAILALVAPLAAGAQATPQPSPLRFEVASVKPTDLNQRQIVHRTRVYPGGRISISACDLRGLVLIAFHIPAWQLVSRESWMEEVMYEVDARAPESTPATVTDLRSTTYNIEDERVREMMQALLIDRFQLKFHRETKPGDVYLLERSGKPLALQPAAANPSWNGLGYNDGQWIMRSMGMPQLASFANDMLSAPVLDRTELSGLFDYKERDADEPPVYGGDRSDSFQRFLHEFGLKLERTRGPVETFVIDSAARPSPN
jgi:uncharacterized protein (TIGR03435 family)